MNKKVFLPSLPDSEEFVEALTRGDYYEISIVTDEGMAMINGWAENYQDTIEGIEKLTKIISLAAELKQNLEAKKDELEGVGTPKTRIKQNILARLYVKEILDQVAARNKVAPGTIKEWITYENPEIVKIYNARLIAELLNIGIHEVWE